MSNQLTAKQENFSQAIVDGLNQSDAYRHAYAAENMKPATVANNSYKLMQDNDIATRIKSLRDAVTAAVTEKRVWDSVRLIDEAEVNMVRAREQKQFAAANGALHLIGQTAGLLTGRPPDEPVKITKVTVVLNHGDAVHEFEGHDQPAIEAVTRELPAADKEENQP